jgi:hypothetical protein
MKYSIDSMRPNAHKGGSRGSAACWCYAKETPLAPLASSAESPESAGVKVDARYVGFGDPELPKSIRLTTSYCNVRGDGTER